MYYILLMAQQTATPGATPPTPSNDMIGIGGNNSNLISKYSYLFSYMEINNEKY